MRKRKIDSTERQMLKNFRDVQAEVGVRMMGVDAMMGILRKQIECGVIAMVMQVGPRAAKQPVPLVDLSPKVPTGSYPDVLLPASNASLKGRRPKPRVNAGRRRGSRTRRVSRA